MPLLSFTSTYLAIHDFIITVQSRSICTIIIYNTNHSRSLMSLNVFTHLLYSSCLYVIYTAVHSTYCCTGAMEVGLVVKGKEANLVRMGDLNTEVYIALLGIVLICVLTHYHINGSFAITIITCSFLWWFYSHQWPSGVFGLDPIVIFNVHLYHEIDFNPMLQELITDLLLLYILYLNGLTSSLSRLADLVNEDGNIPRGRWIYVVVGFTTVLSGFLTGVPILISPEGAAAIKEGAKTGLSTVVCGVLFLCSCFFAPIFQSIPAASSSRKFNSDSPLIMSFIFYIPYTVLYMHFY